MVGMITVLAPGMATTVQDLPGRSGLWGVGVPPSGAWDDVSFAAANRAVGNQPGAAGLEAVVRGPRLRFGAPTVVCVAGAAGAATLDGVALPVGTPVPVGPDQVLDLGPVRGPGLRGYVAVAGGLAVPVVLGSRSTFLLGGFGGLDGRALRAGDVLPIGGAVDGEPTDVRVLLPELTDDWTIRVIAGPHGAPEYLTEDGMAALFDAEWRLDHRSDRTGLRLVGPAPRWSRADGGEAGLHPSNIHDSPYPVGGVMLSGGTPVIVGPDGPSLGGFVVPAVVVRADRWKLGQCRPGDRIRLVPVSPDDAPPAAPGRPTVAMSHRPDPLVALPADGERPALTVRRAGDHHVLVEAGPPRLDLAVRLRVHLLARELAGTATSGLLESVEGVRSLLLEADPARLPLPVLAETVAAAWVGLPPLDAVELPVRRVTMPIAFDDPSAHEAMSRYTERVRPDAPWCPDNVEFIRRVNGLDRRSDVFEVLRTATYLVVGLGDVYLGAPVAVPLDPAHRLVTTKYDPPRTWTPANAVGIGGVYLCVYGMEGPGGYQLVGRTVPVWRNPSTTAPGEPPWLLRPFDLLEFRPVGPDELRAVRAEIAAGRAGLDTRPATLGLAELIAAAGPDTSGFTARREAAYAAERDRWAMAAAVTR